MFSRAERMLSFMNSTLISERSGVSVVAVGLGGGHELPFTHPADGIYNKQNGLGQFSDLDWK